MRKIFFGTLITLCFFCFRSEAADFYVKTISVDGLQRVEKETVLAYLGVKPAETISQEQMDSAFKNLYATGLFADIKMNAE